MQAHAAYRHIAGARVALLSYVAVGLCKPHNGHTEQQLNKDTQRQTIGRVGKVKRRERDGGQMQDHTEKGLVSFLMWRSRSPHLFGSSLGSNADDSVPSGSSAHNGTM